MNIADWITKSAKQLRNTGIESSRLDVEIILSHTLHKSRTWLHAHGDEKLTDRAVEVADARLELRKDFTPIAYIIGHKEFYGRNFSVTPSTLIPRPESETLIDLLKENIDTSRLFDNPPMQLIDIGTGSGCLGITAKLELPELAVTLADVSRHALTIARKNAKSLKAEVDVIKSDLLTHYPIKPDYIIANLPYVDRSWYTNNEIKHEPDLALYADDDGLQFIKQLLVQASTQLAPNGIILLEADPRQHQTIIEEADRHGLVLRTKKDFIVVLSKAN